MPSGPAQLAAITAEMTSEGHALLQGYIKPIVDAIPELDSTNLDQNAQPLADIINIRTTCYPSESDHYTLRLVLDLIYQRAHATAAWTKSACFLLSRLCVLIQCTINNAEERPIAASLLVRKLVHQTLFADFSNRILRSAGCVSLLGDFFNLPAKATLNLNAGTLHTAFQMILSEPRDPVGFDIQLAVMLVEDAKKKLWLLPGPNYLHQMKVALLGLTMDERVPEFSQLEVAELLAKMRDDEPIHL
jgi:hypothetical protein